MAFQGVVQLRTYTTVTMLGLLLVFLGIVGYGAPATTTLSPVDKFKSIVNAEVDALWNSVDHDSSGNLEESDLENIFDQYDDNNDKQISQTEFLTHFVGHQQNLDIIAQGLYYELDMDNDSEITGSDLQRYFEKIDTNDDNSIEKPEFETFFRDTLTLLFVLQYEGHLTSPMPTHT
ncbi:uncharacterized protein LOC132546101 [Ylistrum balloti]|uniref:uncharacterized protein LOC132546101 n=1 Tax=Ylistrum balloti TaxID=509963 RepID=UPI002905DFE4|nr:uncharacterized protein LOC132546101 [Ylistrum balloti]